jgi:FixJ family two-component response regulator
MPRLLPRQPVQPESATPVVLIVDDRKDVAATMADLCRAFGFAAEVGEEGIDMFALLERHRPAAVIVDVMMPGQDGYEALKEVARFDPMLPVLLVTGHGDDWLRIGQTLGRAQGLATVQTASKPVRAPALRAFLDGVRRG